MSIFLNTGSSIWSGRLCQSDERHVLTVNKWGQSNNKFIDATFADGALWPSSRGLGMQFSESITGDADSYSGAYEAPAFDEYGGQQVKKIIGFTFDGNGDPLGSCIIQGFLTTNDAYIGQTASDPTGYYELTTPFTGAHYIVAYKSGSPDVAGTSINTLMPV